MNQSLSAEEIAELQRNITGYEFPVEYVQKVTFDAKTAEALLAMASRLVELESACEFLQTSDRRVCLVVDYRAPGEATHQVRAWAFPMVAKQLGWPGPTSQAKGG